MSEPAQAQQVYFTVLGEPASKANSRRLVKCKGRMISIKSSKAISYLDSFRWQCPRLKTLFSTPVAVEIHIWYASRRPDLDDSVILDAMQGLIYANDRQVQERHVFWGLDPANPRCDITVRAITDRAGASQAVRPRSGRKGTDPSGAIGKVA